MIFHLIHKWQISDLWKEISSLNRLAKESEESTINQTLGLGANPVFKKRREIVGNLINALLDYYYWDTEDDEETDECARHILAALRALGGGK